MALKHYLNLMTRISKLWDYNTFERKILSLISKGKNKPIFRFLEVRQYCTEPAAVGAMHDKHNNIGLQTVPNRAIQINRGGKETEDLLG